MQEYECAVNNQQSNSLRARQRLHLKNPSKHLNFPPLLSLSTLLKNRVDKLSNRWHISPLFGALYSLFLGSEADVATDEGIYTYIEG